MEPREIIKLSAPRIDPKTEWKDLKHPEWVLKDLETRRQKYKTGLKKKVKKGADVGKEVGGWAGLLTGAVAGAKASSKYGKKYIVPATVGAGLLTSALGGLIGKVIGEGYTRRKGKPIIKAQKRLTSRIKAGEKYFRENPYK